MIPPRPLPTRVTVITVSFGSAPVLPALLDSIELATAEPTPVIVVDNADHDDDVREIAEARGLGYLPLPNPGYGGAVNAAVRRFGVSTDWLLIVNPDVTLEPGSIDLLVATGETDAAIGAVGPLILDDDGAVYPSARRLPSLAYGTGHALLGRIWPANPWSTAYRRANEAPIPRDAEWLSGACALVRREAFERIGGFDDSFFMYFEDVDLGARLLQAGYRNRYEPRAIVHHSGAHSTERSLSLMTAAHHESAYRFLAKRYPGAWWAPVRLVLRAGLKARAWATIGRR
jgi:N-acetylglucosaminyl-diphospho-decaprenol L-rhamnosyltransferase